MGIKLLLENRDFKIIKECFLISEQLIIFILEFKALEYASRIQTFISFSEIYRADFIKIQKNTLS